MRLDLHPELHRHQAGRFPRNVRSRGTRADLVASPSEGWGPSEQVRGCSPWDASLRWHDGVAMRNNESPEGRSVRLLRVGERSEEHTSELQSLMRNSYAVFCLK